MPDDFALIAKCQEQFPDRRPRRLVKIHLGGPNTTSRGGFGGVHRVDRDNYGLLIQGKILEAFFSATFSSLGKHDDDGYIGSLLPDHMPKVTQSCLLGSLSRYVGGDDSGAGVFQGDGRGVDVVRFAWRNLQTDT